MKHIFFRQSFRVAMLLFLAVPGVVLAAMSGSNYTIYADSVEVGGVGLSTSTGYSLEGTLGEPVSGISTSTGYEVRAGFQSMEREDLSLSLSTNSVSLGELSDADVKSASTVATVTSNAATGYTLGVDAVSGTITATVNDGAVTAGQDEYGFSVSGDDSAFSGDKAVAAGQAIASANINRVDIPTTLTFKGSRSAAASAGSYSQVITLLLSANL